MNNPVTDDTLREIYTAIALWHLTPIGGRSPDPNVMIALPALAVGLADEVVKELNKLKVRP